MLHPPGAKRPGESSADEEQPCAESSTTIIVDLDGGKKIVDLDAEVIPTTCITDAATLSTVSVDFKVSASEAAASSQAEEIDGLG